MAGIIITGHGHFASGMENSLGMLVGKQEFLKAVNFEDGHDETILKENLRNAYDLIENKDVVFVLCDILGGSPFKNSVECFFEKENVKIAYGVNLGMIIELTMKCMVMEDADDVEQIIDEVIQAGKASMDQFVFLPKGDDSLEEGI